MGTRELRSARLAPLLLLLVVALFLARALGLTYWVQSGTYGFDISYPQGSGPYPYESGNVFGVVGVTGGRAFTQNAYLASQYRWVTGKGLRPSLYINLNYPVGSTALQGATGPKGTCAGGDEACRAYNYGWNAARYASNYANSQGATASTWWLDIETVNSWSAEPSLNAQVIQGAWDCLTGQGQTVGVYSTVSMWQEIAGSFSPGWPVWLAGAPSKSAMHALCATVSFTGGPVWLVQYSNGAYDLDYACP